MPKENLNEWYENSVLNRVMGNPPEEQSTDEIPSAPPVTQNQQPEKKDERHSKFSFLINKTNDAVCELQKLESPFNNDEEMRIFLLDQIKDFIKKIDEV